MPTMQLLLATRETGLTPSLPREGGGNPSEPAVSDAVDGRSFLGVKILNFIIHAYSFSHGKPRQLPLGGSLSHNTFFTFSLFVFFL